MYKKIIPFVVATAIVFSLIGCKDDVIPKPSGFLRLDYNEAEYASFGNYCPYGFDMNASAIIRETKDCSFTINYPKMKATVYLTYKPVENNINALLRDAQKLTYEHVIKADDIVEQPYLNPEK